MTGFAAGEMLYVAESFIEKAYHPTVICRGKCCRRMLIVS